MQWSLESPSIKIFKCQFVYDFKKLIQCKLGIMICQLVLQLSPLGILRLLYLIKHPLYTSISIDFIAFVRLCLMMEWTKDLSNCWTIFLLLLCIYYTCVCVTYSQLSSWKASVLRLLTSLLLTTFGYPCLQVNFENVLICCCCGN